MRKTTALLLALMMAGLVVPGAASETVTDSYTAAGVWPLPAYTRTTFEVDLVASKPYANVTVVASELAPISLCFWDPGSSAPSCATDGHASGVACGANTLMNSPFPSTTVTVWVHQAAVSPDLSVCAGTSGVVTGHFF